MGNMGNQQCGEGVGEGSRDGRAGSRQELGVLHSQRRDNFKYYDIAQFHRILFITGQMKNRNNGHLT
jgi:hypothetical protein